MLLFDIWSITFNWIIVRIAMQLRSATIHPTLNPIGLNINGMAKKGRLSFLSIIFCFHLFFCTFLQKWICSFSLKIRSSLGLAILIDTNERSCNYFTHWIGLITVITRLCNLVNRSRHLSLAFFEFSSRSLLCLVIGLFNRAIRWRFHFLSPIRIVLL